MRRFILLLIIMPIYPVLIYGQIERNIPPDQPKLVVGIVVEQMRMDYLDRYWDKFSNDGFKKLANGGSFCRNAHLNYSLTQSCPGFATISTGTEPSGHGIVSNYWYNPITGEREQSVINGRYSVLECSESKQSYSPKNLYSASFSDEAKLFNNNKSKIISISLTPEAAVLTGGFTANGAYWFNKKTGKWTSSSYYMESLPNWVNDFNKRGTADRFLERVWNPLLNHHDYADVLIDNSAYEFGIYGKFKDFPYKYQEIIKYIRDYELLGMIPEGNTITTDFAATALLQENLGQNESTDFLFINYSAQKEIANRFGPQSKELMDMYLRLDQDIAHLITVLEESIGKNNFILYLTSNSGVSEVPQYLIDNKMPGGYFRHHYIRALLGSYLRAIYGEGDWVLDFSNNQIYLNKTLIEDSQISLSEFQETVANFIINSNGIAYSITASNMLNNVYLDGMPNRMQNSFNPKRSGDVIISLSPGWIEDMTNVVNNNSGYNYDTHVPMIWYGWKVRRQTILDEINISNIAPTISMILNSPRPALATGQPMNFIFLNR